MWIIGLPQSTPQPSWVNTAHLAPPADDLYVLSKCATDHCLYLVPPADPIVQLVVSVNKNPLRRSRNLAIIDYSLK